MATHFADVNSRSETAVLTRPYRGTAIVVGFLLIVCSLASLLSVAPLG